MKRAKLKLKIGGPSGLPSCSLEKCYQCYGPGIDLLEEGIIEGENPVFDPEFVTYCTLSKSRVAWDRCTNREVNSF